VTSVVLGQVHVTVADVERSVAFYRDVIGLPFLFDVPAQKMAFLDLGGGVRLYLAEAGSEDERFRSRPLLYYTVPDIDAAWIAATQAGAPAVSPPHVVHRAGSTELWTAFVQDPDGVVVGLMAERAATPSP
jgi:catechol 2,3-dioxygenase-like lactoylglutathione lyase family enzyme